MKFGYELFTIGSELLFKFGNSKTLHIYASLKKGWSPLGSQNSNARRELPKLVFFRSQFFITWDRVQVLINPEINILLFTSEDPFNIGIKFCVDLPNLRINSIL